MKNGSEKSEYLKKRFNWLGLLSIIAYTAIFVLLCMATFSGPSPMDSGWWLLLCAWIIPGLLLPLTAWIYADRLHLQAIKEDAVVVYKALEFERKWASGGYFHHVEVPVLTFELLQSKRQLKFKRLIKHFNSLQVGDAGVIVYKKKNEKCFFVDFVRK